MNNKRICYLVLMSSGLDSTGAFLKLINEKITDIDVIFPVYVWWRSKFISVIKKEFRNCHKIISFVDKKYSVKNLNIIKLNKIDVPLQYYENIRTQFKKLGRNDYWCHFRNGIFIFSSMSYLLNYLKLNEINDFKKIIIVTGFIGNLTDENELFIKNIKNLINCSLRSLNPYTINLVEELDFYSPYFNKSHTIYSDICKFGCWEILKYTWSCWRNKKKPCYNCVGCNDRKRKYSSFKNENKELSDPFFKYLIERSN